jgi:hypothetical protein
MESETSAFVRACLRPISANLSYHSIVIDLEIDHDMDPAIAERLIHDR